MKERKHKLMTTDPRISEINKQIKFLDQDNVALIMRKNKIERAEPEMCCDICKSTYEDDEEQGYYLSPEDVELLDSEINCVANDTGAFYWLKHNVLPFNVCPDCNTYLEER